MGRARASIKLVLLVFVIGVFALIIMIPGNHLKSIVFRPTCRLICSILGIEIEHFGESVQGSSLILCNHISYLDVFIVGALFGPCFVAKEEVSYWPLIGSLTQKLGCIFVKRECLTSRVKCLHKIRNVLGAKSVCIFPQGTTTGELSLVDSPWYRGQYRAALDAQRPLVLMGLVYDDISLAAWLGDDKLLPHLWRVLKHKNLRAVLTSQTSGTMKPLSLKQQMTRLVQQSQNFMEDDYVKRPKSVSVSCRVGS